MPIALQMPFCSPSTRSSRSPDARQLLVTDLSQHETIPDPYSSHRDDRHAFIAKITPTTTGGDPAQQKIMMFMPLMFDSCSTLERLVLYWLTAIRISPSSSSTDATAVRSCPIQVTKKKNGRK